MERIIATFIDDTSIYAQLTGSGSINATLTDEEGEIRGTVSRYKVDVTYQGDYIVKPKANEEVVLDTSDKILTDDITVLEIPYSYTVNGNSTIAVVIGGSGEQPKIYVKVNGSWIAATAVYKKVNGSWVLQSNVASVFNSSTNYRKGN